MYFHFAQSTYMAEFQPISSRKPRPTSCHVCRRKPNNGAMGHKGVSNAVIIYIQKTRNYVWQINDTNDSLLIESKLQ